jgi:hypothetical protein
MVGMTFFQTKEFLKLLLVHANSQVHNKVQFAKDLPYSISTAKSFERIYEI